MVLCYGVPTSALHLNCISMVSEVLRDIFNYKYTLKSLVLTSVNFNIFYLLIIYYLLSEYILLPTFNPSINLYSRR